MAETRKFAVLLLRHDTTVAPPSVADCRAVLLTGDFAVAKYWRENTEDWVDYAAFDFYGWYDVMLPPPRSSRVTISTAAYDAAVAAGANLDGYDSFIVLVCPGTATIPNPALVANPAATPPTVVETYDGGTLIVRTGDPRPCCSMATFDSHVILCHEVGHVLGFPHSNGIPNSGADWSNDGVSQTYPVYGDPYDIMSGGRFGDADPTFQLPASEQRANLPNVQKAGPMLSRAMLHVVKPIALEAKGKVKHVQEGEESFVTLYPAGRGEVGGTELICFHPAGEDAQGRGRVYVEYRQSFNFNFRSRCAARSRGKAARRDPP